VCLPQPPHCGQRGSGSHPGLLGLCVWGGCVLLGQASGCCPWGTSGALLACAFTPIFATTLRGPSLLHPSVWMSRQAESKGCSSKELLASGASQSQLHVSIYFFFPLALSSAWGFCCASLAGSQNGLVQGKLKLCVAVVPALQRLGMGTSSGGGKQAVMSTWESGSSSFQCTGGMMGRDWLGRRSEDDFHAITVLP